MFFFNTRNLSIYSAKFIFISVFLIVSIITISYILTKALLKGFKNYKKQKELLDKIHSINENNAKEILQQLNLNSSYKLKIKNIDNISDLKNLLLKKYYER